MGYKKYLLIFTLIFMISLSIGAISAQDADDTVESSDDGTVLEDSEPSSGTVSGDVNVVTENPFTTNGELSYDVPSDAKTIKSADVYVNVYSGSAENTYGANCNVSLKSNNGETKYNESLWIEEGSKNGTVYEVNDHVTKCYSDYMIHYNVTDLLSGLNGSNLKINVGTFQMENKSFDGRIKLIALVVAYDDDDSDEIKYWINDSQLWSKSNSNVTFNTESLTKMMRVSLTNIVLSSADGTYRVNNELIGDADVHKSGNTYQYNKWDDISDYIKLNQKNTLNVAYAGNSTYGSIKNALSVLVGYNVQTNISIATEYTNSAYAGTNNTLSINVNTNKAGKYTVKLFADNVEVDQIEANLISGDNKILLTDPTIRAVDETTVNGGENKYVNYTVQLLLNEEIISNNSINVPVLYNGNLGKDLAYPSSGFENAEKIVVNGDIVIDIKDVSSYLASANLTRSDVWDVNLDSNSKIVKSFIYVPYNWFNPNLSLNEDINMFNTTFNGVEILPIALYRDQSNLGNYGKCGYGVLIYDVTELISNGSNSFNLTKLEKTPAVYPSTLIYMYNTTGSEIIKEIYISNGADLLSNSSNVANRLACTNSTINVDVADSAKLYVFAASAQTGESNIIFNEKEYVNVWNGTSSTTDLFTADVSDSVKNNNSISFVATGSTILALQQIIVTTHKVSSVISVPASLSMSYKDNKNLVVTLKDGKGNIIPDANISVQLNNKVHNLKTDSKGQATLTIPNNLIPNTYTATINYAGDDSYLNSTAKTSVIVKKASVKLIAKNKKFKAKVKTKKYKVTLKDNKGKAISKAKLTLKIKNKKFKAKTNSKGKATFKITKFNKKKKYSVKISFAGNEYFNKITKKVKITIKK